MQIIEGARLPPCPCHFPWVLWQVLWHFVPIFYSLVISDLRQEVLHTSKVNRYQKIFVVLNLLHLLGELSILLRTWAKRRAKGDISWGDISRRWLCLWLELCSEILPEHVFLSKVKRNSPEKKAWLEYDRLLIDGKMFVYSKVRPSSYHSYLLIISSMSKALHCRKKEELLNVKEKK